MFGKITAKEENVKEKITKEEADLICEERILEDKARFGWVRTSLMRHLRTKYGTDIADRAHWRVNKRHVKDYFKNKQSEQTPSFEQKSDDIFF